MLAKADKQSLYVISAWDSEKLAGLIRGVGDDASILFIQDILVDSRYKRKGIGSALLKQILQRFSHVRQVILQSNASDQSVHAFYEHIGFREACDYGVKCYVINQSQVAFNPCRGFQFL